MLYPDDIFNAGICSISLLLILVFFILVLAYAMKPGQKPFGPVSSGAIPPTYYAEYMNEHLRKNLFAFPKMLYGTLILVGFIALFIGILLVDFSQSIILVAAGAVESIVGLLLILFFFRRYKARMKKTSEELLPEVFSPEKR